MLFQKDKEKGIISLAFHIIPTTKIDKFCIIEYEVIPMVNLKRQYLEKKTEIDAAIQQTLLDGDFIKGKKVQVFEEYLANYTGLPNVISCGNGTDALCLQLWLCNYQRGSKIIVPAFTYIAPAEVVSF